MTRVALFALLPLLLQPGAGAASLEVQVVALGTNVPVARARLVAAKVGGTAADYRTAVADAGGRFVFRNLAAGSYRVYAERQGYLRGEHGRRTANVPGTAVSVVAGPSPAVITIAMIPTGVIAGRVLDDGRPVRNVWIRAMRAVYQDGERTLRTADYARTDDLGEYRIFGLAPGVYIVSALPQARPRIEGDTYVIPTIPSNANNNRSELRTPAREALAAGRIDPAAFDADMFLPVFYPGTIDPAEAAPIDVQPGATIVGIDLTVAHVTPVRVRGRVIDAVTGQVAQDASVSVATAWQFGRTNNIPDASTTAGAFELAAVPPGRYTLIGRANTTGTRLFGMASVDVDDRALDEVEILIHPATTLRGRVTLEGSGGGRNVRVSDISVQLVGTAGMPGYSATRLQPDGAFSIDHVERREYRIRIRHQARVLPATSARFGGDDVADRPFRVGPETAALRLDIVVSLAVGALDISVVDTNQRAVTGTTVALVPEPPRRNESSLYRTVTTDAYGRIHLDDVVPGDYKLFAADVDAAAWQDPDVIRRYENRGTSVAVREGGRQSVTLRVSP